MLGRGSWKFDRNWSHAMEFMEVKASSMEALEKRHFVDIGIGDDSVPDSVPVDRHRPHLKVAILGLFSQEI